MCKSLYVMKEIQFEEDPVIKIYLSDLLNERCYERVPVSNTLSVINMILTFIRFYEC